MCLRLDSINISKATENIVVFKNLGKQGYSRHTSYLYEVGKDNPTIQFNMEAIKRTWEVNKGYHSHKNFINLSFVDRSIENVFNRDLFVIPKGSEYIEGNYNYERDVPNYVSTNIIYMGKVLSPMSWIRLIQYNLKTKNNK